MHACPTLVGSIVALYGGRLQDVSPLEQFFSTTDRHV